MLLFCQVSSEKAEGGLCAKSIPGLQLPCWGKRSSICVLGVGECLWTSVPSSGQWGYDWCLNSIPHSCFLICLCEYFLLLTTLILPSLVTSKGGRLTHCEINFSMLSHRFLFGGIFKILSFVIVFWKDSINLKNYAPLILYCHVSASFMYFFFKKAVRGSLPFALYGFLKKVPH